MKNTVQKPTINQYTTDTVNQRNRNPCPCPRQLGQRDRSQLHNYRKEKTHTREIRSATALHKEIQHRRRKTNEEQIKKKQNKNKHSRKIRTTKKTSSKYAVNRVPGSVPNSKVGETRLHQHITRIYILNIVIRADKPNTKKEQQRKKTGHKTKKKKQPNTEPRNQTSFLRYHPSISVRRPRTMSRKKIKMLMTFVRNYMVFYTQHLPFSLIPTVPSTKYRPTLPSAGNRAHVYVGQRVHCTRRTYINGGPFLAFDGYEK